MLPIKDSSYNVIIIHSSHLAPCLVSFISFHVLPNMQKIVDKACVHIYHCHAVMQHPHPCLLILSLFFSSYILPSLFSFVSLLLLYRYHSSTVQGRSLLPTSVHVKYPMLSATRLEPLRSSSRPLFIRGRTTDRAMALSSSMRFSKRRRFSRL